MKSQNVAYFGKNAMGTMFLLAGAFFVCSTFLSMRSVLADPVAPASSFMPSGGVTSPRATTAPARGTSNTVTRTTSAPSRAVSSRAVVSSVVTPVSASSAVVSSSRPSVASGGKTVVSRGVSSRPSVNAGTIARSVSPRTATTTAAGASRVSLQGSAIRGSTSASNTYTYLSSALYTGNYSNIIDSSTGLISAEAYSNCMESYYTCMDEICTARNASQRRCACAGRVKSFAEAELALESANEELIEVSGQLALLIATKGKDVSSAFKLTDAEQVMNCVSWQEMNKNDTATEEDGVEWCQAHAMFDKNQCSNKIAPTYCSSGAGGNSFGFDIDDLNANGSDILASLKSWADAKEATMTILTNNDSDVDSAFSNLSGVISGMAGLDGALASSGDLKDSLAETWGYELFEYAHNNVCNRVLDSCFNGIYEACGAPGSDIKCGNGQSQCPYNYNSQISVSNTGSYELEFVKPNSNYTASNSATCYGYSTSNGDPYASLRGPVADARRSILQKYALDANADCDTYGEQLRTTAQNISYQKVAAQQALQQKRLEFAQEEAETVLSEAIAAGTNFNECRSEILDCYETQAESEDNWSDSRIKTYCAQIANVPHCYDTMICNPSASQFTAIIDKADDENCENTQDYTTNTCRNIVTLNEILNSDWTSSAVPTSSEYMREQCLRSSFVDEVRNWTGD